MLLWVSDFMVSNFDSLAHINLCHNKIYIKSVVYLLHFYKKYRLYY